VTEGQIEALKRCYEMIAKRPRAKLCEGIGIVAKGEEKH
jgi:ferritin-like metal-binding protein YciE